MKLMVLKYLKLWLAFFRNSLSRDMEFKMNFIGDLFIDSIFYGSMYFFWSIIFSYVDVLGDFNQQAVVIFLIVMYLTDTVFVFIFGANTFTLNTMVIKGDLDLEVRDAKQVRMRLSEEIDSYNKKTAKNNVFRTFLGLPVITIISISTWCMMGLC